MAAVTVAQVVDSVTMSGEAQAADVGTPLDSAVVVTLLDARGHPVVNAPVSFGVLSGGGAVTPATATTGAEGTAGTAWTLGPTAGIQELEFTAGFDGERTGQFTANGYPLEATTLLLYAGDAQTELASTATPEPIRVQVVDSLGNGVPDVPVTFTVDGDAVLDAGEASTDLAGVASVGLTLGTTLGTYTVTALVPDSLTVTGLPLAGSPVQFTAEAVPYVLAPVSSLTVGDTVTLSGTGFAPQPEANSVLVGGIPATILSGGQSELVIEVPSFGCTPERGQTLEISRTGGSASQPVTVTPAGVVSLAAGERLLLPGDADLCLQFLAGSDDEYLVGLTSTSWFDGAASFAMSALDSVGPFPAPVAGRAPARSAGPAAVTALDGSGSFQDVWTSGDEAELRLRRQESTLVSRLDASPVLMTTTAAAPAAAPPTEGDLLDLRLPDLRGDACVDYVPVSAEVFAVGPRLALATSAALPDPSNPVIVPLLEAVNVLNATFGDTGIDLIMGFLGAPALWDADSRVTVVLVPEVAAMGVPAFASAVDQLPRSLCPSSDEGHYVYAAIPDLSALTDLQRMQQLAAVIADAPPDLTHHIAHIVQWTRRLTSGGNLLPSWMAEGQAELIVEHVGLTLSGLGSQQDLGPAILGLPGVSDWIPERFDRLARFQGWDGAAGQVAGAPEGCSLFGFTTSVCHPEGNPGAAWSFIRYVSDRFGPALTGGEPTLHRAIIDMEPTGDIVGQMEDLLGLTLPELMADWAAMLYADGRLTPAQAPDLQMTSWNLEQMIPAGPKRLAPDTHPFADFSRMGGLIGGGTAYTLISSAGAHGGLSVAIDNGAGAAIAPVLAPRVWVVRMR
jgi:hypothetical protein